MSRLNLDQFKLKMESAEQNDVSNLLGQVLGSCHDTSVIQYATSKLGPEHPPLPDFREDPGNQL